MHHSHAWIRDTLRYLFATIAGTIVDDNKLKVGLALQQHRINGTLNGVSFVIQRYYYGNHI